MLHKSQRITFLTRRIRGPCLGLFGLDGALLRDVLRLRFGAAFLLLVGPDFRLLLGAGLLLLVRVALRFRDGFRCTCRRRRRTVLRERDLRRTALRGRDRRIVFCFGPVLFIVAQNSQ